MFYILERKLLQKDLKPISLSQNCKINHSNDWEKIINLKLAIANLYKIQELYFWIWKKNMEKLELIFASKKEFL